VLVVVAVEKINLVVRAVVEMVVSALLQHLQALAEQTLVAEAAVVFTLAEHLQTVVRES